MSQDQVIAQIRDYLNPVMIQHENAITEWEHRLSRAAEEITT